MRKGFTLVETLVAISLLAIAIVPPMLLTVQSLTSAYYARDQITASYLAQEAIEQVHQLRDDNILKIAKGQSANLFDGLPSVSGQPFIVDALTGEMATCSGGCPPLQTQAQTGLYGYSCTLTSNMGPASCALASGWANTNFTRTVTACYVQAGSCSGTVSDEVRVQVTVSWRTASLAQRSVTISEDLYRWVQDGSGT